MDTPSHMTDTAALAVLGERIARHRLERNWTQAELAKEAGVSRRTLIRLEGGESTQLTNLIRVIRALGLLANLDELVPPPVPSPLEQLRSKRKRRKRASGRSQPAADEGSDAGSDAGSDEASAEWTWGDDDEAES